ncbi:PAS domain S-box-containing protein [Scopulibacillus darangshiensis]|uniref:HTH-type transcriptional regulatory protein TyrR n=2 Tax=Scopulibacillus darangshiensis TaxID=442528 RepID=A0A4R2P8M6_9BACL|nr:PAS domain S-box-containing protein [Scopulibacillus darangshiensis]
MNDSSFGSTVFSKEGHVLCHNDAAADLLSMEGPFTNINQMPDDVQNTFFKCSLEGGADHSFGAVRLHFQRVEKQKEYRVLLIVYNDPHYFELEQIINQSFDEILVTDGDGVITKVSKKCEELYGLSEEVLIGQKTADLANRHVFTPSLTPVVQKEKKKVSCIQGTRTGKRLYVIGNPIFDDDGEIYRIVFNSREVSEIEMLESRLQQTENLLNQYRTELRQLRQLVSGEKEVVYQSNEMKEVFQLAAKVAPVDSTVLIAGETGVGKGVMARYIHQEGNRNNNKIIEINCGAIPENLIESELFGYEKGAFTGANKAGKKGVIELADGGTLFLDEVADLSLNVQVKLLQFLQDSCFRRVGGNEPIHVNTRIIAATNQDLPQLVKEKKFREDLFYRLNVVPMMIPPLRHRKDDIAVLVDHFLTQLNLKYQMNKRISDDVYQYLLRYHWPGNVRELENLIERLVVTCEGSKVTIEGLPTYLIDYKSHIQEGIVVKDIIPLKQAVEDLERQLVTQAYLKYKNTYKCAEALQVNQSTVVRKIKKYAKHGKLKNLLTEN